MQRFEIGDKVRVFREPKPWDGYVDPLDKYVGLIGTVIGYNRTYDMYRLDFHLPEAQHKWNFPAWALQFVDDEREELSPGNLSRFFGKEKKND